MELNDSWASSHLESQAEVIRQFVVELASRGGSETNIDESHMSLSIASCDFLPPAGSLLKHVHVASHTFIGRPSI